MTMTRLSMNYLNIFPHSKDFGYDLITEFSIQYQIAT